MSKEYWLQRQKQRLDLVDYIVNQRIKDMEFIINTSIENIEKEVEKLYIKYAKDNEMSYQEALSYLTDNERKEFQKDLKYYIDSYKDNQRSIQYRAELQALSTRARVSRLEALKANIRKEVTRLEQLLLNDARETMNLVYEESYLYNIFSIESYLNNNIKFDLPPKNIINELLRYPWSGRNYSEKVWTITDNFTKKLDNVITTGLIQGRHPRIIATDLRNAVVGKNGNGGKKYEYERLVRTEAAFIAEQATINSYKNCNVPKYEYLATLDLRTSDICQSLDGKIFNSEDAVPGKNYPPMHPWCRSTTVPVIEWEGEESNTSERIARDPATGRNHFIKNMTYDKWKNQYIPSIKDSQSVLSNNDSYDIISDKKWLSSDFATKKKFDRHVEKHLYQYGDITTEEYLNLARELLAEPLSQDVKGFVSKDGFVFKYRKSTNDFAVGRADGKISTLFKPNENIEYWKDQMSLFKKEE